MARRLTLAGRIGLEVDGEPLPSPGLGRSGRTALAFLVCERHRPVRRDELADVLWREELPTSWEQMLRGVVFKLRRTLAAAGIDGATALDSSAGAYRLRLPPDVAVDVEEAAADLAAARKALDGGDAPGAGAAAGRAVAVASRQFAPGAAGLWAESRQAELRELHLAALEAGAEAALARADWAAAVVVAEEAVAVEPYRESAWALLMAAHAGAGNRAAALAVYQRCRVTLAEELGVKPAPATEAAYLRLLGDEAAPDTGAGVAPLALPTAVVAAPGAFVVGREVEAEALATAFKRATVEGRRAVLVSGEPGVGKTTLVAQAARAAHGQGARVFYGRCDEDLGAPYQPFAQALSHYVLAAPIGELTDHVGAHGGELVRLVPALGRRLPGLPLPPTAGPGADRWRLFEAVVGLLEGASTAAPVAVVLDDLHWADAGTLLLLRHLLVSTAAARLLVLATFRDSEVGADLADALADLRRLPGVDRLAVAGLGPAGVEAFVAATREPDNASATLARDLWARTAGNPFLVGELLRHLDETAGSPGGGVPAGVAEVVGRRLGRLSADAGRTLALASVVGADFGLDLLEAAAGPTDADGVLDALEEATAARLVVETGPGAYRFAHALIRDALYGRLAATRRARLHRRVGEGLEAMPGDDASRLPALAHHFTEAVPTGCSAEAAGYALAAANQALAVGAPESAIAMLQRALAGLEEQLAPDHGRRAELLIALSKAHFGAIQNTQGVETAVRAVVAARAGGTVDQLAWAVILQGTFGSPGPDHQQQVEMALQRLGEQRLDLRARLLAVRKPWAEMTDELMAEALETARQSSDGRALGEVLEQHWYVLLGTPRARDFLAAADELVACGQASFPAFGYHPFLGMHPGCYDKRALARLVNGDRDGFDADVDELDRIGRETMSPSARSNSARWRVVQALMDGRFEDVPALDAHFDSFYRPGVPRARYEALLYWEQGRVPEMVELSTRMAHANPGVCFVRALLLMARAAAGDTTTIRPTLAELITELPNAQKSERLTTAAHLAEAAVALDDHVVSAQLYDWIFPYRAQVVAGYTGCLGSVDRHLGILATVLGRWHTAMNHFEVALGVDAGLRAPPLLARTRYWYAHLLATMPDGDPAKAMQLAGAARLVASELAMAALLDQVNEVLDGVDRLTDATVAAAVVEP